MHGQTLLWIATRVSRLRAVPRASDPDPALASALRARRSDSGRSLEDVARRAGLSLDAYARIERGLSDPRWSTVRRIVTALDMTLAELAAATDDAET